MSDNYLSLVKSIIARLKADSATGAIIGDRIYTDVPQQEVFPYAVLSISSSDFSSVTFTGMEHTVQINIYSRTKSPKETADARKAIYNSLNRQENALSLDSGNMAYINFGGVADIFKDNDGTTWVGVIQFNSVITE